MFFYYWGFFSFCIKKRYYYGIAPFYFTKYWKYGFTNMFIRLWVSRSWCFSRYFCFNHFVSLYIRCFLADRKFSLQVILKSPPFYAIIIAVFLLYYDYELPGFIENNYFFINVCHDIFNFDVIRNSTNKT